MIRTKNTIKSQPVATLKWGINNPIAASISMTPVKYTIANLLGTKSGNIITIPLEKAKCALAVKSSITDKAIRPDNAGL